MEQADADVMCFGYTHKPYHRILPTETTSETHYRYAINIGSAGKRCVRRWHYETGIPFAPLW